MGGRELLMMNDTDGNTTLHSVFKNENTSMEIIAKLLEMGGNKLLIKNGQNRNTALHCACEHKNASME